MNGADPRAQPAKGTREAGAGLGPPVSSWRLAGQNPMATRITISGLEPQNLHFEILPDDSS